MIFDFLMSTFIDPFVMLPFLKRALVASIMIAISSGLVGVFLLLNRMSLVGDALSHGVLPGIAVAFLFFGFNIFAMSVGGVIAGVLIAILASLVSRYTNLKEDASFAALYLLSLAIGVVLIMEIGSQADLCACCGCFLSLSRMERACSNVDSPLYNLSTASFIYC